SMPRNDRANLSANDPPDLRRPRPPIVVVRAADARRPPPGVLAVPALPASTPLAALGFASGAGRGPVVAAGAGAHPGGARQSGGRTLAVERGDAALFNEFPQTV